MTLNVVFSPIIVIAHLPQCMDSITSITPFYLQIHQFTHGHNCIIQIYTWKHCIIQFTHGNIASFNLHMETLHHSIYTWKHCIIQFTHGNNCVTQIYTWKQLYHSIIHMETIVSLKSTQKQLYHSNSEIQKCKGNDYKNFQTS